MPTKRPLVSRVVIVVVVGIVSVPLLVTRAECKLVANFDCLNSQGEASVQPEIQKMADSVQAIAKAIHKNDAPPTPKCSELTPVAESEIPSSCDSEEQLCPCGQDTVLYHGQDSSRRSDVCLKATVAKDKTGKWRAYFQMHFEDKGYGLPFSTKYIELSVGGKTYPIFFGVNFVVFPGGTFPHDLIPADPDKVPDTYKIYLNGLEEMEALPNIRMKVWGGHPARNCKPDTIERHIPINAT